VKNIQETRLDIVIQNAFGTITRLVIASARLVASDLGKTISFIDNSRQQDVPASVYFPKVRKMVLTNLRYNFVALAHLATVVLRDQIAKVAASINAEKSTNDFFYFVCSPVRISLATCVNCRKNRRGYS
jgi:hypothetical protein